MPLSQEIRLDGSLLDGTSVNVTIPESTRAGGLIGQLSPGFTYRLVQDDGRMVFLDGNQLRLTEGAVLDDLGKPQLEITLEATDSLGGTFLVTAVIAVEAYPGHEVLRGGSGNDMLDSDNGQGDYVLGRRGDDTILADASDVVVLSGRRSDYLILAEGGDTGGGYGSGGGYGGGDGYGGEATPLTITLQDLRTAEDGTDQVIATSAPTFRFADGDYRLVELLEPEMAAARLSLDGRVLDEHKYIPENSEPGVIGQLGLRGQDGAVPTIQDIEVLAFVEGQIFPWTMALEDSPFALDEAGVLSLVHPLNYEDFNAYAIRVFYQDANDRSGFEVLRIAPVDIDDAPVLDYAPGLFEPHEISQFTDLGTDLLVGYLSVADEDGSTGEISYVLGGLDAEKFFVADGALYLKAGTEIDTGAPFDFDLSVTIRDSSLAAETSTTHDLDIKVTRPDPLDSLSWDYVAPRDIRVYVLPGALFIEENYNLFANPDEGFTSVGFTLEQIAAMQRAFDVFVEILNISVTFVNSLAEANFAMIGAPTLDGALADWAIAGGELTAGGETVALEGWGRFNTEDLGDYVPVEGSEAFYVLVHEIGHGLGLAHPHDDGGDSVIMEGVDSDFDSYGAFDLNQGVYTMMSYNRGWALGPMGGPDRNESGLADGHVAGPAALDIAVLQGKYGANTTTGAGDDVYMLGDLVHRTIWDNGGRDRIRYDGVQSVEIHLQAATLDYSPTGGGPISHVTTQRGGLTIAAGVVIEEAMGGWSDDIITGNAANNRLAGRGGRDWLVGGDGDDLLLGGTGADWIEGGAGFDTISFGPRTTAVTVDLEMGWSSDGDEIIEVESVFGSQGADMIYGDEARNLLRGGLGDDTLVGRGGNDTLMGGAGADRLEGGAGRDRASYATSTAGVEIDLGRGTARGGDAEGDVLVDIEDLRGSAHADLLIGDDLANRLIGIEGDDRLIGGAGNDTLLGGAGADVFVFDLGTGRDRIMDFGAEDQISLTADLWASLDLQAVEDFFSGHVTQMLDHVLLSLGMTNEVRLYGVALPDLTLGQIVLE